MEKKINPITGKKIAFEFDGHLEKRVKDMTPKERYIGSGDRWFLNGRLIKEEWIIRIIQNKECDKV